MSSLSRSRPWWLLAFGPLAACVLSADDFNRTEDRPTLIVPEAAPPPAGSPEGDALYQVLFADEAGPQARALGQRARMLAWLRRMALRPEQLQGLLDLARELEAAEAAVAQAAEVVGEREAVALGPVYQDVVRTLARDTPPSEDDLYQLAARLERAHADAAQGVDLRRERYLALRRSLERARAWIDTLDVAQQERLLESRYFLRRRLGALTTPGDHERLVTTWWDAGDFSTLDDAPAQATDGMDLGGLWSAEANRREPDGQTTAVQQQAIVVMAAFEPGLPEAIEVLLGQRAALDFRELGER